MKGLTWVSLRAVTLGLLLVLLGQGFALGGSPSEPTTTLKSTFPVENAPQQFQLVQQVLDFPPGAWTPAHSHGGLVFVTIAKGEVTQFSDGKETTYKVGETWTETPGHPHQAGNVTSPPARTLVTFLLPPDAKQTTPQELAGAHDSSIKTSAKVSKFDVPSVARPFDVVEMELDFAPGQQQASRAYGGPAFISVLDGELQVQTNGMQKSVKAGETWTETPGQYSTVSNAGSALATAYVTVLLPRNAKLMALQSQAGPQPSTLPVTGGALGPTTVEQTLVPAAIIAVLIVVGSLLWLRDARRAG